MRPTKNELVLRRFTKFSKTDINSSSLFTEISENSDSIGGVIRRGQLSWLARGPLLEVFSLRNGHKISSFRFDLISSFQRCFITCVSEIDVPNVSYCLLAVGVQFGDDPGGMVSIYSVQESKILRSIETADKITCCHIICAGIVERTILEMFQGCLAIGTDTGKIILLDLFLSRCEKALAEMKSRDDDLNLVPCHIVLSTMDSEHIRRHFMHSRRENVSFGIQLEIMDDADLVLSIQSLTPLLALAAGLEDGRMVLYDLTDLQAFHLAYPPEDMSPLVKMCFVEPPDDPRAVIYIWAFHENRKSSIAVLHSVMYDKKTIDDDDEDNFYVFEGFQSCSVRLTLPMFERGSIPVGCQSVSKLPTHDGEETISLCLLAWKSQKTTEILIFDTNQWYKEQMPSIGDWRDNLSYLASFPLRDGTTQDVWIDGRTIAPFNSIQRPEEHFFPISLSFDCTVLQENECSQFHWPGLQNRALEMLNAAGPSALLEPSVYYHEVVKASLVPQSSDYTFGSALSLNAQRDVLLSVALEYNCFGLLKECAKCWADGSHLGRKPDESLSLSTLTTWVWKRAEQIKDRCNMLCVPLFDHSGLRIDQRSQKELSYCSRQLKLLADLMALILTKCRQYIPEDVNATLTTQCNSIKMASEYQEVLQWLLNIGLLPEAATNFGEGSSFLDNYYETQCPLISYPYKVLRNYYTAQRMKFKKINSGLLSARTQSCRILFIDSFIERECNPNVLREHWQESGGGSGLYPPSSLQAMLRVMLVPDVPVENKYALFIYLFLDLTMALDNERFAGVVQNLIKFPAVFAMNSSTVKTVQGFWNLDHGQFEASLEDIISPFLNDRKLLHWQKELLIEALLIHHVPKLALRALQAPGPPISSLLELKTLLANDLVAEAFHLQRSKNDIDLFRHFLTGCLCLGKMASLLDLALTEQENQILEEFLREKKSAKTENLHFVHLLQRSKYIEAVQQLDELSRSRQNQRSVDLETPNLVLAAYNTTMTPATKQLSEVYYGIRNRLKAKPPEAQHLNTLSSELLRCNANDLAGGVYHSSIMSVDEATNYWDESLQRERTRLQNSSNVPFIRRPQLELYSGFRNTSSISYPEVYKDTQKRRLDASMESHERLSLDHRENPKKRQRINDSLSGYKVSEPMNTSLLTRFRNCHKPAESEQEESLIMRNQSRPAEKDKSTAAAADLCTPIVRSSRTWDGPRDDSLPDKSDLNGPDRVSTPQSILKMPGAISSPFKKTVELTSRQTVTQRRSATPIRSEMSRRSLTPRRSPTPQRSLTPRRSPTPQRSASSQDSAEYANEDDKSIRFDLKRKSESPNESLEESQISSMTTTSPSAQISRRIYGPQPRRALRSANRSIVSNSGDEEFFSPQTSRDNSLKQDEEIELVKPRTHEERPIESHPTDGPKQRKPLARSRSRSKTPDVPVSPSRKSTRLLEKSKTELMEIREETATTEGASQTKPAAKSLSRLVFELNAKKASSTLQSAESSIQSLDIGRVVAQSTQIFETQTNEFRKYSDDSIFEKTSSFAETTVSSIKTHLQDDSEVSDSFKAEWNNRCRGSDVLMTTVELGSCDVTMEQLNPPRNLLSDSSMEFSRIIGRKSYKDDSQKIAEEVPAEVRTEADQERVESEKDQEEDENESLSQSEDQRRENTAEEQDSSICSHDAEDQVISPGAKGEIIEIPTSPESDEHVELVVAIEDRETDVSDEEKFSSVNSSKDQEEEAAEEAGASDAESGSESSSSRVISISSGSSTSTQSVSSESSFSLRTGSSSRSPETNQDDHDLLYGDLDNPQTFTTLHSNKFDEELEADRNAAAIVLEINLPKQVIVPEENIEEAKNPSIHQPVQIEVVTSIVDPERDSLVAEKTTDDASLDLNRAVLIETTVTSANATIGFSDSGFGNAPSGMTLNVLTGEYESMDYDDNDDDEEMATNFTEGELNRGRLEATSTKMQEVSAQETRPSIVSHTVDDSAYVAKEEEVIDILERPILESTVRSMSDVSSGIASEFTDSTLKPSDNTDVKEETASKAGSLEETTSSKMEESSSVSLLDKAMLEDTTVSDVTSEVAVKIEEDTIEEPQPSVCQRSPKKSITIEKTPEKSDNFDVKEETASKADSLEITSSKMEESSSASLLDKGMLEDTTVGDVTSEVSVKREEDSTEEPQPSVSPRSPEKSKTIEKTHEKNTDDIRLKVSDDEDDKVAADGHKKIKSPVNKIETPVKDSVNEQYTTDSDRILRSARRRSTSIDSENTRPDLFSDSPSIASRLLRASSVPRVELAETPTKSKLRKRANSADNPSTPTRILTRRQSILLDRIEEDSVLDSPRQLRKRIPSTVDSEDLLPKTPVMMKRTRKASNSSVDTPELKSHSAAALKAAAVHVLSEDNSLTPRCAIRRLSVSKQTPKATPTQDAKVAKATTKSRVVKKPTPETSSSRESTSADESEELEGSVEDLTKVSGKGVRKLFSKAKEKHALLREKPADDESSPEKSSASATYSSSRRMTRNQETVLEKSAAVAKKKPETNARTVARRRPSKMDESPAKADDASETASIVSNKSKQSTESAGIRRVTRSSSLKGDNDDEVASLASSTKSIRSAKGKKAKAETSPDKNLNVIAEDDQENVKISSEDDSDEDVGSTKSGNSKGRAAAKKAPSKRAQK